jgi:exodeoxyribonuclease VII large subunit
VAAFGERARRAVRQLIAVRTSRAERGGELLAAFSYRGVLARGFALVRDGKGRPLRMAAAITAGMPLEIEFSDGRIGARAEDNPATERASAPSKPRARRAGSSGQGDLF